MAYANCQTCSKDSCKDCNKVLYFCRDFDEETRTYDYCEYYDECNKRDMPFMWSICNIVTEFAYREEYPFDGS